MNVAHCKHGFKYLMVDRDGLIVEKSQVGFLYADDVCLIASNECDIRWKSSEPHFACIGYFCSWFRVGLCSKQVQHSL